MCLTPSCLSEAVPLAVTEIKMWPGGLCHSVCVCVCVYVCECEIRLVFVRSFPYTPDVSFSEEFLLHS